MSPKIPEEELIDELKATAEELGRIPSTTDIKEHSEFSAVVYLHRFGSFENAKAAAGLPASPKPTPDKADKEELRDEIKRLAGELGHTPRLDDLDHHSEYTKHEFQKTFETWLSALESVGMERYWKNAADASVRMGENWESQRAAALDRDGAKCRDCGMTREEHTERWGRDLCVHHRRPRDDFLDGEEDTLPPEANDLENLITLCLRCHRKWESLPVQLEP